MMSEQVIETTSCSNCGGSKLVNEAVVDEYKGNYFCDEICFRDWASDNMDEVIDYYVDLNVYLN